MSILLSSDFNSIQKLQSQVAEEVGMKTYIPIKDPIVKDCLVRGTIFGCFIKDRLIAVCIGFSQAEDSVIYRKILPKINFDEGFMRIAYVVSPDSREKGTTKILLKECLEAGRELGLNHVLATVSPMNGKSIKILLDNGFQIINVSDHYFGSLRYATYLDLRNIQLGITSDTWIDSTEIELQSKLLKNGYVGVAAKRSDTSGTLISYAQL